MKLKTKTAVFLSEQKPQFYEQPEEKLTVWDIIALMDHDSYRRVKGKIRQQRWAGDR